MYAMYTFPGALDIKGVFMDIYIYIYIYNQVCIKDHIQSNRIRPRKASW